MYYYFNFCFCNIYLYAGTWLHAYMCIKILIMHTYTACFIMYKILNSMPEFLLILILYAGCMLSSLYSFTASYIYIFIHLYICKHLCTGTYLRNSIFFSTDYYLKHLFHCQKLPVINRDSGIFSPFIFCTSLCRYFINEFPCRSLGRLRTLDSRCSWGDHLQKKFYQLY